MEKVPLVPSEKTPLETQVHVPYEKLTLQSTLKDLLAMIGTMFIILLCYRIMSGIQRDLYCY